MSAAAIPPALAPRLGALLRMLGSDQDGEALGAARALRRTLDGAGLDLHALAEVVEQGVRVVRHDQKSAAPAWWTDRTARSGDLVLDREQQQRVRLAIVRALGSGSLTDWETTFTSSILARLRDCRGRLTERQGDALGRLLHRLGEGAAWA